VSSTRQRIAELGLELPEPPAPRGTYRPVAVHGSIAQVSGQLSREGNRVITGPVTATTAPALITRAGRACVLRALSALAHAPCDLDRVEEILFVRGFLHAGPDFQDHSTVLDSASAVLLDIFGTAGDLAVLLADGARSISDFAVLLDQPSCSARRLHGDGVAGSGQDRHRDAQGIPGPGRPFTCAGSGAAPQTAHRNSCRIAPPHLSCT